MNIIFSSLELYYKEFLYVAISFFGHADKPLDPMNSGAKRLAILFLICLLPVYWIAVSAPATGIYHDDGIYLVTA